jgi:7-carboxy-7-deazaguanine synthase
MRLNDIYPTIQGEGVMTGVPMVVVRLQGCGVGCPWCDTKETWFSNPDNRVTVLEDALGTNARWVDASPSTIACKARELGPAIGWVLLTGGEPAEQDIGDLVDAFHDHRFKVALETSGTALGHVNALINWVCISPKFDMPGGKPVLPEAFATADEIKQVVATAADIDRLDAFLLTIRRNRPLTICLQPVSQQPKATKLCVETCLARGWRLSLQVHKYLEVR